MYLYSMVFLSATAFAGDAPIEILVQEEGDAVSLTVHAQTGSVALPACRAVGWERVDEETGEYVALPGPACGPMEDAIWPGDEGISVRFEPKSAGFQVVRPVVVYGVGCRPGVPFAMADCDSIEVIRGPNASIRPKAPPAK